jgi:hypothetical protein
MKTFYLKTRDGEVINSVKVYRKIEAIEYFSEVKVMNEDDLLNVFIVSSKK